MIAAKLVIESGASWSEAGLALLSDAMVKGSALLLCCALATLFMRRASAASRHLVWTFGVIGALLMPPLMYVLPAWRIALPIPSLIPDPGLDLAISAAATNEAALVSALESRSAQDRSAATGLDQARTGQAIAFDVATVPVGLDWRRLAVAIWLGGVAVSLASLLFSMLRVRRLQSGTLLVSTGPCVAAVARVSARIGLARPPRLHVGDERLMPMVWGLWRPVLLLPAGAARWSPAKLEAVLLHELAHVRRRDALTQFVAELARAVYWFNPLVWLAARRLYLEREHACDDIVLNAGTRASDYARELLELVRSLRTTRATAMAAIAMARRSQIKLRLSAVLDDARSRTSVDGRWFAVASLGALVLILPLAAMRPFASAADIPVLQLDPDRVHPRVQPTTKSATIPAAQQERTAQSSGGAEQLPLTSTIRALASGVVQIARPAQSVVAEVSVVQATCWSAERRSNSISTNTDEDLTTVKWSSGRCSGSVRLEGRVRLSGDFSGVTSIASGGLFRLEEDDGETERRLVIRPANGQLTYAYRVDGRDREFDAAGRAWLSSALATLFRTTGFAAAERVDYLLRTQGATGVLAEVGKMRSDYVQRVYLQKLLERGDLSPAQIKQAVELSAREIESDYELAQLLIAFSKQYSLNDETRAILIEATNTIESDYEQRRVLAAALAKGELRSQDVAAMLTAAQNIGSDHERGQLLLGLAQKYKLDPGMRTAYLAAAQGIRSDYEKRRVYDHLIKQGNLSTSDIAQVLQYATSMSSDYEKAQVLMGLNQFDLSDAALQRAFLQATARIRSDYEHRRVLSALLSKEKLAAGNLDLALLSAAEIESDHELAQVLLLILKNHSLNEQQRAAFVKALNSISSTHEYGRVASALLKSSN